MGWRAVAAEGGGARGGGVVGAEVGDGELEAGFEEEEGGPAGCVAQEVWGEAAVEGREGVVCSGEGADEGDGGRGGGGCWGEGAAVDWKGGYRG